uniref:Uncharacterized protein n=1 Tax=Molossus molossus TaxID=27622 RepID=A0A7J8DBT7_MOLMO|nr:hypothetical protein HJG59_009407 [Molossus molossus]
MSQTASRTDGNTTHTASAGTLQAPGGRFLRGRHPLVHQCAMNCAQPEPAFGGRAGFSDRPSGKRGGAWSTFTLQATEPLTGSSAQPPATSATSRHTGADCYLLVGTLWRYRERSRPKSFF